MNNQLRHVSVENKRIDVRISIIILLSALLCSIALMYVSSIAAFLALPLLCYTLFGSVSRKQMMNHGALFGAVSSLILNSWMIRVVPEYVQGSMTAGLLCYAASALVQGILYALQFYLFAVIRIGESSRFSLVHNTLLMASLWVLFEYFRSEAFSAMPWLSYSIGITEAGSLYLIQPAALGGTHILSFLMIVVAYLTAYIFFKKSWKLSLVPLSILLLQFGAGAWMYNSIQKKTESGTEKFSAALILPALRPETVWNDDNAGELVKGLLSLNAQAAQSKPDLIVWTETVVPWTYLPEDDFLKAITSETLKEGVHSLIGMNTAAGNSNQLLSNSAYFLNPAGKVQTRYDKQDLLTLAEKPLFTTDGAIILPFLASKGMKMMPGDHSMPLQTPWGKAGILLCNESTSSSLAKNMVNKGAAFLVNMGNDSWFLNTFICRQHFYNCRLRAVENRKDMVVNLNMGMTGVIRATGEIAAHYDGKRSSVQVAEVFPNTLPSCNSFIFIMFMGILLLISIINKVLIQTKQTT